MGARGSAENKALINKMSKAMIGTESKSDSDINTTAQKNSSGKKIAPTYAFGRYQFVPHLHLDKLKEHVKNSDDFTEAQKAAIAKMPSNTEWKALRKQGWSNKGKGWDAEAKQILAPVLNDSFVQKGYYTEWMETEIIPQAEKQYKKYGKDLNLTLEGIIGLNHNRGTDGAWNLLDKASKESNLVRGTDKSIMNRNMDSSNAISPNKYIKSFEDKILKEGGTLNRQRTIPLTKAEIKAAESEYDAQIASAKSIDDVTQRRNKIDEINREYQQKLGSDQKDNYVNKSLYKDFISRENKIIADNTMNDAQKQKAIMELHEDINTAGMIDTWNQRSEDINKAEKTKRDDFQSGKKGTGLVHKLIQSGEFNHDDKKGTFLLSATVSDLGEEEELKAYAKANGLKLISHRADDQKLQIQSNPGGVTLGVKQNYTGPTKVFLTGKNPVEFLEKVDKSIRDINGGTSFYFDSKGVGKPTAEDIKNGATKNQHQLTIKKDLKGTVDLKEVKVRHILDKSALRDRNAERDAETAQADAEEEAARIAREAEDDSEVVDDTEANVKKADKTAQDYFDNFLEGKETIVPETFQYDKGSFADKIPLEALGQGALALMGLADADTELPLRDEQVSEAVRAMAREQKRLSELGLKPEEEAAMKANIADVYSEGINQLVRASGGDRNVVLGGMQSLNQNRLKGILEVSIEDIKRKDAMYAEYNKTMMYIDQFNSNRDIANYDIKLNEAKEKRMAGGALAASGFANMLDELQYQKENGPGSANHQYQQSLLYKLYGYIPGMKDNGKGDTPGTYSNFLKQRAGVLENNESIKKQNALKATREAEWRAMSSEEKIEAHRNGYFEKLAKEDAAYKTERANIGTTSYTQPTYGNDKAKVSPNTQKASTEAQGIITPFIPKMNTEKMEALKTFQTFDTKITSGNKNNDVFKSLYPDLDEQLKLSGISSTNFNNIST